MNIILNILLTALIIYIGYFFIIIILGLIKKNKIKIKEDKENKFAILIAARNEEVVIGNLIDSLKKQDYKKELYDIYVIINNCTDNTKKVSIEHGAKVIECTDKVSSKGEVLKFTYNKLRKEKDIDAYIIFDADNLVDKKFLKEMNIMLNKGYNVAQGSRNTKNIENWISSSYTILYYMQSIFLNKVRYNLNKSSFINGTGFMVKKEVIDKYGYNPETLTEDVEFTAMCAINNEKIAYAENALFYDEQVVKFSDSIKQRKRWTFGTIQCMKKYWRELIDKGIKEKRFECIDVILFDLLVIFQILLSIALIVLLVYLLLTSKTIGTTLLLIFIALLVIYIIEIIIRVFLLKYHRNNLIKSISGILMFDLFMFSWIPINIICLFQKECIWVPIKHDRNIKIDNN